MDPAQLQPGHRLDRYELLCPLAYGGMASVWLARFGGRKGFERLVVVKMILPQYSQDPRFQEMFLDEARIASRIEHANVARILDVGEHDESTFIVMEWVDGDSLSKVVRAAEQRKQRIPAGIALRVCADAAAGLHAAHVLQERDGTHLGVVHRDVSPQNILISNAGSTVLIDFGVAKARDRVSQDTSAGQLKGKIRYMAPEQALGRAVDHRADVWALGAILYELFAGVAPYDAPNEVATLHKLTSGEGYPPLPQGVPDAVCAVIDRALSYDPNGRFATALELNLALESCMLEIGEPTTTAVVAHYTGALLSERKAARKRAVDTALGAAHARDAERNASMPLAIATPGMLIPSTPRLPTTTARFSAPVPISSPAISERGERTSSPSGPLGVGGLSETPSATSNATLGSAAMEYPPHVPEDPARRRRVVLAALLGVSVAAGLVGSVLIISSALMKPRAPAASTGRPSVVAPAETVDPSTVGAGTTTATTATPPATAELPSAAVTATPATTATNTAAPAVTMPSTAVTLPTPTTVTPAAPATTHRPVAGAAIVPPKPTTKPPPAVPTTKPDRGF